ncbi:hypothetical protein DMB92_04035 [Campylobacter sp. MIT 99-7217]|nr:hypothetical protein [Campylobacter sp. MIT 99-7217]TQR33170.1 hypothetical protein DMB92_04035 [Campylobacter sp. MIT 99-7217]
MLSKMKIFSILSLACDLKSPIFKRLSSPLQSKRIIGFMLDIRGIFEQEGVAFEDRLCKGLDLVVQFKKDYPDDFDELFIIIKEILDEWGKNGDIKKNLKELLK